MAKNNGGFLLGAIVGGIAGAVTVMLLTSEKGKQWLAEINETGKLEPMKTTATEWLEVAKEKTKEVTKFIPIGKTDEKLSSSESTTPSETSVIPISVPASEKDKENIEKLLKEAEEAFHDAEQKLQKQNETE
ncbi:YtxH domain-containing protein [Parageobacillus toebii]|jgi:gas vesicle protein|uniref:YtxH domain-containing protein n=1 Tax=Parageobacillus toebii TaxID=153151 RepID=UPI0035B50AC8